MSGNKFKPRSCLPRERERETERERERERGRERESLALAHVTLEAVMLGLRQLS